MSKNREIQCEYSATRSNENKCKALEIEFHNCLNILEQKKCPIYKLKQQLQAKKQECEELKKQLDKYLNQEEEEIRQLNNDNKLDDILLAIERANYKLEKESAYKKSLDEIEEFINKQRYIISVVRAPLKPIIMRINRDFLSILEIINKTKEGK